MGKFKCSNCNMLFESKELQREFVDPVYGPCKVNYSYCPYCGSESSEFKRQMKKNNNYKKDELCQGTCSCCNFK